MKNPRVMGVRMLQTLKLLNFTYIGKFIIISLAIESFKLIAPDLKNSSPLRGPALEQGLVFLQGGQYRSRTCLQHPL